MTKSSTLAVVVLTTHLVKVADIAQSTTAGNGACNVFGFYIRSAGRQS